jgi:DNA modification methylase
MTYQILKGNSLDLLPTLADNSIDAIVTDPPYGLGNPDPDYIIKAIQLWASGDRAHIPEGKGFMGKSWDSFVPPPAIWDECLRVLKPGGHLLAFAGTRTYDLMGISIRMAGFEIRDSIGWVYGSGFPKSLDVSKAIDKGQGQNLQRQFAFTAWMRSVGMTAKQIDEITDTKMGSHYTTHPTQPAIPTADLFDKLRAYLPEVPEEIERLVAERTGIEWKDYKNRKVIGQKQGTKSVDSGGHGIVPGGITEPVELDITAPATPEAQQWQGWGTALKPALEPIVVARKPLIGTVAENVLTHGTGGLNIDASRIGSDITKDPNYRPNAKNHTGHGSSFSVGGENTRDKKDLPDAGFHNSQGRWPANLILSHAESCQPTGKTIKSKTGAGKRTATFGTQDTQSGGDGSGGWSGYEYETEVYECVEGCPVKTLDEQSGQTASKQALMNSGPKSEGWGLHNREPGIRGHNDSGGASRFFYVAKASKRDRNEGLDELPEIQTTGGGGLTAELREDGSLETASAGGKYGSIKAKQTNFHPTVKPTALMQYLVKLVTPPGGTVLDPFTGSGSTGKAAILEGFDFIGIELTEDYWPIIEGRLKHAEAKVAERIKETSDQEQEKLF